MNRESDILSRAVSHTPDAFIAAAHAPRRKWRRVRPFLIAACLLALLIAVFPLLRRAIDTDSSILGPTGDGNAVGGAEPAIPLDMPKAGLQVPLSLGASTVTMTAVTPTAATFTVQKADDTPLYIALYGLRGGTMASTEPGYRENGITIRPYTIRLTVNGADAVTYHLPAAPGTYTVTVSFATVRNGAYPMQELMGFYAYIGEDGHRQSVAFDLKARADSTAGSTADTVPIPDPADTDA